MKDLKKSCVAFDSGRHIYTAEDGRELSGVTPVVDWVYPKDYQDVNPVWMKMAADRGTSVHLDCQLSDTGIEVDTPEVKAYQRLKKDYGLKTYANEWLVDDGRFASKIDVIFDDGTICDIKTTSQIHFHRVSLQLSIYAYLLEGMNEGLKVEKLCVIWLPKAQYGAPELAWVDRIPGEKVQAILTDYHEGKGNERALSLLGASEGEKVTALSELDEKELQYVRAAEMEIVKMQQAAAEMKRKDAELKEGLMKLMLKKGLQKYDGEYINISIKDAYKRNSVDTARLKKEFAEAYKACLKTTEVSATIQIKVK